MELGESIREHVKKVLDGNPRKEVKESLESMLTVLSKKQLFAEDYPRLRSVELLEHIGTDEAKAILEDLAKGSADHPVTVEAKAAVRRLSRGDRDTRAHYERRFVPRAAPTGAMKRIPLSAPVG
jgi:hypothetical protein